MGTGRGRQLVAGQEKKSQTEQAKRGGAREDSWRGVGHGVWEGRVDGRQRVVDTPMDFDREGRHERPGRVEKLI